MTETRVTGAVGLPRGSSPSRPRRIAVDLPGEDEPVSLEQALSRLQDPTATRASSGRRGVTEALRPGLRTRAFVFNKLLQDKATKDRLRAYPNWLASRNLANEASDESVEALIEAVRARYELARRWYRLKARLLGLDRLGYWDRMAPVGETDERIPYDEARRSCSTATPSFSPELGAVAGEFFVRRLHRRARRGRASAAARSAPTRCRAPHPYVMLNYTSRPHDVLMMAHELGHGVHATLARAAGHLPVHHPADAGRDRLDLRGDDRARPPARARPGRRRAAVAAGRLARRRRRPRCSARSR